MLKTILLLLHIQISMADILKGPLCVALVYTFVRI